MKILCLQLARFGDIYQTWPVLNALKRTHPEAEIHFLVRERFQEATRGLQSVARVWALPTQSILRPLASDRPNLSVALEKVTDFVSGLKNENFDCILNLSFSPSSSYLVDMVAQHHTSVLGYTRHRDGYFCIPDDASSYFYAQVGVERSNRIHLSDLFALIACVELQDSDFQKPKYTSALRLPEKYIVVHAGASQKNKSCTAEQWSTLAEELLQNYSGALVFVGSKEEAASVPTDLEAHRVVNLAGQTELFQLFEILDRADMLIGCDSVALHMASLVNKKTLNISFSTVRFWETGPRATGSRILWFENVQDVNVSRIVREAELMLANKPASDFSIEKVETTGVIYQLNGYGEEDYTWELTKSLYMSHPFPLTDVKHIRLGFTRLRELASVALENLAVIKDPTRQVAASSILNEVDHLVDYIGQAVPSLSPVVRWFQTEKMRIGPVTFDEVLGITKTLFEKLNDICQIYEMNQSFNEALPRTDLSWKS
jgi:heptosyltransferase-3